MLFDTLTQKKNRLKSASATICVVKNYHFGAKIWPLTSILTLPPWHKVLGHIAFEVLSHILEGYSSIYVSSKYQTLLGLFWVLMSFDGPDRILPICHHLMSFDGPKNLMSFDEPKPRFSPVKISCLLMDPICTYIFKVFPSKTSCLLMDPLLN